MELNNFSLSFFLKCVCADQIFLYTFHEFQKVFIKSIEKKNKKVLIKLIVIEKSIEFIIRSTIIEKSIKST